MSNLDTLIHCTYPHLFDISPKVLVGGPTANMEEQLTAKVMDDITFATIEIPALYRAINHTRTVTGAATLLRSLIQPLTSLELIHAKQDSVRELEEDVELAYKLAEYVNSLVEKEEDMYQYFFARLDKWTQYSVYRAASVFFERLVSGIEHVPIPKTPYLETLIQDIRSIDGTRGIELIQGPVYSTFGGLKPRSEMRFFTPGVKFTPRSVKPILLVAPWLIPVLTVMNGNSEMTFFSFMFPLFGAMSMMMTSDIDLAIFIRPLKDIYVVDSNIRKGIDAIGKIDELLSFHEYAKAMNGEVVMSVVTEASQHYFVAKGVRNPIILNIDSYCVPNDVNLQGQKLTFITGPNDGGKTTYCKTIAQLQVMAQIGCYVPAEQAEISIADRILYQEPEFGSLEGARGGLKAQLRRARKIFFHSTPASLVVLDDILRGATTHKEALEKTSEILDGFHTIGNNTILITHAYELVEQFAQQGRSQTLQAEFRNEMPTRRLIPGISRESHSDFVSDQVGFSKEDIQRHLRRKGYLE